jgi:hypothetical protein
LTFQIAKLSPVSRSFSVSGSMREVEVILAELSLLWIEFVVD